MKRRSTSEILQATAADLVAVSDDVSAGPEQTRLLSLAQVLSAASELPIVSQALAMLPDAQALLDILDQADREREATSGCG